MPKNIWWEKDRNDFNLQHASQYNLVGQTFDLVCFGVLFYEWIQLIMETYYNDYFIFIQV